MRGGHEERRRRGEEKGSRGAELQRGLHKRIDGELWQ